MVEVEAEVEVVANKRQVLKSVRSWKPMSLSSRNKNHNLKSRNKVTQKTISHNIKSQTLISETNKKVMKTVKEVKMKWRKQESKENLRWKRE